MSMIGKVIGPFQADAVHNGKFIKVHDTDLLHKWSVFCFYPADFTFVCPTELEQLAEVYEAQLKGMGVEVYAVSTDTHFTHLAWHQSSPAIGKVTYKMVGDPSHHLSKEFEVLIAESGMADRGTFIVDPDGVVQNVEISAGAIGRDATTLVKKIRALQFIREHGDEACPFGWDEEDGSTLKPGEDLVGKI